MLTITDDASMAAWCSSSLRAADPARPRWLTERFDAWVNATDRVPNLVIRAGKLPGLGRLRGALQAPALHPRAPAAGRAGCDRLGRPGPRPRAAARPASRLGRRPALPGRGPGGGARLGRRAAGRGKPRHADRGSARRRARPLGRGRRSAPATTPRRSCPLIEAKLAHASEAPAALPDRPGVRGLSPPVRSGATRWSASST